MVNHGYQVVLATSLAGDVWWRPRVQVCCRFNLRFRLFLGRSGAGFIWVFITSSLRTDFLVSCSYIVPLGLEAVL